MFLFVPLVSLKSAPVKIEPEFSIYTGKVLHRTEEGCWWFELFGNDIIRTTFIPQGYVTGEQVSNAVIAKPSIPRQIQVKKSSQQIDFDDLATVALKDGKYHYNFYNSASDIIASYFSIAEFRGFRFALKEDEHIYGGGERGLPLNRRGYGFSLYNAPDFSYGEGAENLNFSVPFIFSSKGYGIFFDNASKGYIDAGRKDTSVLEAGFSSGELTFYIINGKTPEEILRRYTTLVGRQPLPARWVLGNLMSRFGYRSEAQLSAIIKKMKEEDFPIDAAILDLFWFGDSIRNTMGNFEFINNKKWPDPEGMIKRFKEEGINTVLISEPYFVMGTRNYSGSKPFHAVDKDNNPYTLTNFYFGFGGLIDVFRKDAREWFWGRYKQHIDKGIAGWWGDLGEPETHPGDIYHNLKDFGHDRLFASGEVHNLYGHFWNKMIFENYQQDYPDTRVFNLNRAGFAGSQRYSVFPWSGDVNRNWSGLRAQLPVMLGMSLSGIPYIHSDAGGFAGGRKDPELYTRWLQFAAFTPVFRPHGTALEELDRPEAHIESEPVFYPEPYKSIVRNYMHLRYKLLPYNYTLAYRQTRDGAPLTRPMFYNDSSDPNLLQAHDQYMWGDNILVAPVVHKGATCRKLYLPKGIWYKMFANIKVKGGQWINDQVTIDHIPLYVKAGSFIPCQHSSLKSTMDYTGHALDVTYYPSASSSSYTMFDDNGKSSTSLQKHEYELIQFSANVTGADCTIGISSNQGEFEGRPETRSIALTVPALGKRPRVVKLNNKVVPVLEKYGKVNADAVATWDPFRLTLSVKVDFCGKDEEISWSI